MSLRHIIFSAFFALTTAVQAGADPMLIMVEEEGCLWCARWNKEISEIYPKTSEGKAAPLKRIDIHDKRPANITFARPLSFTPTFVLVVDNQEVSRIEGYPGEGFFWGLLARMLNETKIEVSG
ncbi:hypothetical protein [Planktotalea sp.]|uniref:hypothetical protein n=1 Tax=Planktotalea sp. TaxID=2029877 RepID=UPI003299ADB7